MPWYSLPILPECMCNVIVVPSSSASIPICCGSCSSLSSHNSRASVQQSNEERIEKEIDMSEGEEEDDDEEDGGGGKVTLKCCE